MEFVKEKLRHDKGFDGCYEQLCIGAIQIAIIQEKVSKKEAIAIAEHFVKCWNSHDALLASCKAALSCFNYDSDMQEDFAPEIKQLEQAIAAAQDGSDAK